MDRPLLTPRMERNFTRKFRKSSPKAFSVSAADMRRISKVMKPLLPELIRHLVFEQHFDNAGRLVIYAPGRYRRTDRIVYDPKQDCWESEGSAGRGWVGLIARLLNGLDGGQSGGLVVLQSLSASLGLAVLQIVEKQIRSGEKPPYPWRSIAESADEAIAHIDYPDHRTADEQSRVGDCS